MTISYEQALTGWLVICLIILVCILITAVKLSSSGKIKQSTLVYFTGAFTVVTLAVFGGLFLRADEVYRYDNIDFENSGNTYNLVYEVSRIDDTDKVKVIYLDKSFNIHEVEVDLSDSIIGTTVCSIGLDGKYNKYLDLGALRVEKEQTRNLLVLNKYWAIQLGLMEATGNDDEKPFNFNGLDEVLEATPSEVKE